MIGILTWLGILSVILCLYWGYKVPKLIFKSKKAGWIGFFIAFAIFFGDHIYKYIKLWGICQIYSVDKIYNQAEYDRFQMNSFKEKKNRVNGNELEYLMKKLDIQNFYPVAIIDSNKNYLYFSVKKNKDNQEIYCNKIINIKTKEIISENQDYDGGQGGWFFRLMDLDSGKAYIGSCRTNGFGEF